MKQIKILVAAALFLTTNGYILAQTKIGHINSDELVQAMPETKTAQKELEKIQKQYEEDIKGMIKEFRAKRTKYEGEAKVKTDVVNATRAKELQETEQRIGQFQQNASQELQKKRIDLLTPIMEKARKAIHEVAKAKGLNYVLDSALGKGIIYSEGIDLMKDVKKKLGIKAETKAK